MFNSNALIIVLVCFSLQGFCQQSVPTEATKFYTVLGSFAVHSNAKKFIRQLERDNIKANYFSNERATLHYVYTDVFDLRQDAEKLAREFRKNPKYYDAWVKIVRPQAMIGTLPLTDVVVTPLLNPLDVTNMVISDSIPVVPIQVNFSNTECFFSLYDATNNKSIPGRVQVVDPDKTELVAEIKGNEYSTVPVPNNKSSKVLLICDVFGYRKVQYEVDFRDPLRDSTDYLELFGSTVVVHFDLVRYRRGDITTLYNVFFYNDAAIMTVESKYQLQELLNVMKTNPGLTIKLHGHSNGNYVGKIISPAVDENFFSLATDVKETMGTARLLSQRRAEVVKNFLVHNGIEEERIKVQGWGGRRSLFEKFSPRAKRNLRVDVEITRE